MKGTLRRQSRASALVPRSVIVISIACFLGSVFCEDSASHSGGAGHALLFSDHAPVLRNFKNFASDAFTFEAWVSTSDYCHRGGVMSYALDTKETDASKRDQAANHFVIFDPYDVIACHDFQYLDLWPDPNRVSCMSAFNRTHTANFIDRRGDWHHLAVTWSKAGNGRTRIYKDGLLMAETASGKTNPLQSGGAFMLGGEQDCYGGCTDASQAFYGLMDEVRLWKVERTQDNILKFMRRTGGSLDNHNELVAYWKFNEPDEAGGTSHFVAKDSSGNGNDLPLVSPPLHSDVDISKDGKQLSTGSLSFANNYAFNPEMIDMPRKDFTVEFWARTPAYDADKSASNSFTSLFSYATHTERTNIFSGGVTDSVFTDDAIRIEKYYDEFRSTRDLNYLDIPTRGSITIHINSNRDGNGRRFENWLDYAVQWLDGDWHHIAATWEANSGETALYFDGVKQTPFWRATGGRVEQEYPSSGGVDSHLAWGTNRHGHGSLVLGQNQECYGACFSPSEALTGDIAALRIWGRALSQEDIRADMFSEKPGTELDLLAMYNFRSQDISSAHGGKEMVSDSRGKQDNQLELWADAPRWEYSTAPLMDWDSGEALAPADPGSRGHSLLLNDQQALTLTEFQNWPRDAITVEFWMMSVDKCRKGVPFSYATGGYEQADNSFLILNYNDWGISVMEDEGQVGDHTSGISATDGTWHHIAVTWQSSDGAASLYDNGRKVWEVTRSKGKHMPSGGTLVVGREQDCVGGCFDSAPGASGKLDPLKDQEYGAQDFFGAIDELRVWRTVRTQDQIKQGMATASEGNSGAVSEHDPDLVAYWKFDEGKGYLVKDSTSHGNNLYLTGEPKWQVVKWLSVCGNGLVEGQEQCDDGNTSDGDGCSAQCKVEEGWECTGQSPSECWPVGESGQHPGSGPVQPYHPDSGLSSGDAAGQSAQGANANSGSSGHTVAIILTVIFTVLLLGCFGVGILYREALMDAFPAVEQRVRGLGDRLRGRQRSSLYQGLDTLDPEERLDISPEFVGAVRHPQGPYAPLNGQDENSR
ncbi:probable Sushi, von Willebrand factor type A, EGF and pentraxin pentraxin domain-containing protein at C-terminar half [Coccomyxa sp. Obi]|nr:probable Sushi, von Willebrand factor type A, EGF and pentraxin pentraxin domain-containing protein at C-terminar half [Coccomyxa sp. Obi]